MQGRMYGNENNRIHEHWFASYRFTHDTEQIGIKICWLQQNTENLDFLIPKEYRENLEDKGKDSTFYSVIPYFQQIPVLLFI